MTCQRCGQPCERRGKCQKYCISCSEIRDLERVREWRAARPEYERQRRIADPLNHVVRNQRRRARVRETYNESADQAIRELAGQPCFYCGKPGEHIDHKIPLARGGAHVADNLVSACSRCNWRKGAKTDAEFRSFLDKEHALGII